MESIETIIQFLSDSKYIPQSANKIADKFKGHKNFTIDFEELTCAEDVCIAFNEFLAFQGISDTSVFNYSYSNYLI